MASTPPREAAAPIALTLETIVAMLIMAKWCLADCKYASVARYCEEDYYLPLSASAALPTYPPALRAACGRAATYL